MRWFKRKGEFDDDGLKDTDINVYTLDTEHNTHKRRVFLSVWGDHVVKSGNMIIPLEDFDGNACEGKLNEQNQFGRRSLVKWRLAKPSKSQLVVGTLQS